MFNFPDEKLLKKEKLGSNFSVERLKSNSAREVFAILTVLLKYWGQLIILSTSVFHIGAGEN